MRDLDLEVVLGIRATRTGEVPDAVYAYRAEVTELLRAHGYDVRTVKQVIHRKRPAREGPWSTSR